MQKIYINRLLFHIPAWLFTLSAGSPSEEIMTHCINMFRHLSTASLTFLHSISVWSFQVVLFVRNQSQLTVNHWVPLIWAILRNATNLALPIRYTWSYHAFQSRQRLIDWPICHATITKLNATVRWWRSRKDDYFVSDHNGRKDIDGT